MFAAGPRWRRSTGSRSRSRSGRRSTKRFDFFIIGVANPLVYR
jgi:hypothetical protein